MRAIIRHYYTYTLVQNKVSSIQMINCFGHYIGLQPHLPITIAIVFPYILPYIEYKFINQFVYYTLSESSGQIALLPASYNELVMHL